MREQALVGRDGVLQQLTRTVLGGGSVLIFGPAGVGKSRLLREAARSLAGRRHVQAVAGTPAMRSIPFGPFHELLPQGLTSTAEGLRSVRAALESHADGRPWVLIVDDAQVLDDASLACVAALSRDGVPLLMAVRAGEVLPEDLATLWHDGSVDRLDLAPLCPAETVALAEAMLRGVVRPPLGEQLVRATEGNPLLLRELLVDAVDVGTIAEADGAWDSNEPLRQ